MKQMLQNPTTSFGAFLVLLLLLSGLWGYPLLAQRSIQRVTNETPGLLSEQLDKLSKPLSALRIAGPLNGKDIALLRSLAGATMSTLPVEEGVEAPLEYLDLRKSTFHPDDEAYASPEYARVDANKIGRRMFANCCSLEEIRLPETVTIIDREAFRGARHLRIVSYIDHVTEIEWGAFQECTALADIALPEGLRVVRGEAFKGCNSLRVVTFPSTLADIGSNAYEGTGVRYLNVTIPGDDQAIGNQVFKDCKRLERVSLYGDYATLKYGMFEGCTALRSVRILSNQIHTIQTAAFSGCTSLPEIHLPASVSYIQMDALYNCKALRLLTLPSEENVVMGGMIFEDALAPQITVGVASSLMAEYQSADTWSRCNLVPITECTPVDAVYLQEDFAALPYNINEWGGNDTWRTDHGAYINKVGENQVLKLGDNEGSGHISTKALDLSAHNGHFRVRLAMDGWNDLHSALQVEVRDKESKVLDAHRVHCYDPKKGGNLRVFDFEMCGGAKETFIHLYTTDEERIAIVDDIKIYDTTEAQPLYEVDLPSLDYGIVPVNAELPDVKGLIYGESLKATPSVKVVSKHLGKLSVDAETTDKEGTMTVFVDTETIGDYTGYIQVKSGGVNEILIPFKVSVRDMDNIYGLDDTHPLDLLEESFEDGSGIPSNFVPVALVGKRNWERRYNGDMTNPNRYLSIDGLKSQLDGHKGDIHALIILPALNLSHTDRQAWGLSFDLSVLRPNGAELYLVSVSKQGNITRLKEFTADSECEWTRKQVMLTELPNTPAGFLAFEYVGNAPKRSTTYRIDNVKYQKLSGTQRIPPRQLQYATTAGQLHIYSALPADLISIYTVDGILITQLSGAMHYTTPLSPGLYLIHLDGKTCKVLMPNE